MNLQVNSHQMAEDNKKIFFRIARRCYNVNTHFKKQMADPVLTHRDSKGEQCVSEQITYQSPLDVTVDLSTDQNRALHHINSMRLTAVGEHEWKSYSWLFYDQFMTRWPKLMPGKGMMIVTVCCNNAGKVNDDELPFDYIMLSLQQQSVKRIRRHCIHSPFGPAFIWFRCQILCYDFFYLKHG